MMMQILLTLCVFAFYTTFSVDAALGFDVSVPVDELGWTCLAQDNNATFGLVRVYRNLGQVDRNSSSTILSATGIVNNIDGYMFPCITKSPYSIANNITCNDASTQVKKTLQYLAEAGIGVKNSSLQPTPYFPLRATLSKIFIDIEDEVPSKYYSPTIKDNIDFIKSIIENLQLYGIEVGIYTTKTYWANVMGNIKGYGNLKLWYPHYDNINNMDCFNGDDGIMPFADFNTVYIKQTGGNVDACGLTQVDSNYQEDK
jgi:hypothetical protein